MSFELQFCHSFSLLLVMCEVKTYGSLTVSCRH